MTDQREQVSPVTIHPKDDNGAEVVERRGTEYVVVFEPEPWMDTDLMAMTGPGPRWYIRTPEEDIPIPQHNALAALGEARTYEAEGKVKPPRRAGQPR